MGALTGAAAGITSAGPVPFSTAGDVVSAYRLDGFPFAIVVIGLFVVVFLRAQLTYWLGRGLAAGTIKAGLAESLSRRLAGPAFARAMRLLNRWGPFAVTLCFLTIGIQTMVNLAAGLGRMPLLRYTVAMVPGCVAWAFIYGTVGLTAFYAGVAAAAGSPWAVATIVGVLLGAVLLRVWLRRRRVAGPQAAGDGPVLPEAESR